MATMTTIRVTHKTFGEGSVVTIRDSFIIVKFDSEKDIRMFKFPSSFNGFLKVIDNPEFEEVVKEALKVEEIKEAKAKLEAEERMEQIQRDIIHKNRVVRKVCRKNKICRGNLTKHNSLIGDSAWDLHLSEQDFYEIIGYLCVPGRVSNIEADVPNDYHIGLFEDTFPGQPYNVRTYVNTDPKYKNMITNVSMTICFADDSNCPERLKKELQHDTLYPARLYRTKFICNLVENFGFQFGKKQDVDRIRKIAEENGYLEYFEKGFARKVVKTNVRTVSVGNAIA